MENGYVTEMISHGRGKTKPGNKIDRRTHEITQGVMDRLIGFLNESKQAAPVFSAEIALRALGKILAQHFPKLQIEIIYSEGMGKIPVRFYKQRGNQVTPCGYMELHISGHVTPAEIERYAESLPLLSENSNLR